MPDAVSQSDATRAVARGVVAGILVGGASRRMGRPKALLRVRRDGTILWDEAGDSDSGGETLLERTVRVARQVSNDEVVLLGTPQFDVPASLRDVKFVPDRYADVGPIGGLEAALSHAQGRDVMLLACDMPRITPDLLARLRLVDGVDVVAYAMSPPPEGWQPCCAVYGSQIAATVQKQIQSGQRAMIRVLERVRVQTLGVPVSEHRQLQNLNSPQEPAA